uniref:Uncharacterized protein n=1 Tax=Triticum urartu TaxID=4572 RepID=A0A8R7PRN6_TRIUA
MALTQEINLQTAGVTNQVPPLYEPQIIASLTQERESRLVQEVVQGPLAQSAFIQEQSLSQPPVQHSTTTKGGDVHRKREVIALARLRATAKRREIADQAKYDAAMAKLKEEEEKINLSAQRRKDELLAKKMLPRRERKLY